MTEQEQKDSLESVDSRIDELQHQIDIGKAIEELHEIPAFQTVILDGYLEAEAERLFGILTNPTFFKRDQMENTMDRLNSVRHMKEYFMVKLQEADAAVDQIATENVFRSEVTATSTAIDAEIVS